MYTGTHDNDTSLNWYQTLPQAAKDQLLAYLGSSHDSVAESMPWPLIRLALASTAVLAMVPMQDLLGLGDGHRMNTPGSQGQNWGWRFQWDQVPNNMPGTLKAINACYGR